MSISLQPQFTSQRPFAVKHRRLKRQLVKFTLALLTLLTSTYLLEDIHYDQNSNSAVLAISNLAATVAWNPPARAWGLASWFADSVNGAANTLNSLPQTEVKTQIGGYELTYKLNPAQRFGAKACSSFGDITDREVIKLGYLAQPQRVTTLQRFLGSPAHVGQNTWYYESSKGQIVVYLNGDSATWQFIQ